MKKTLPTSIQGTGFLESFSIQNLIKNDSFGQPAFGGAILFKNDIVGVFNELGDIPLEWLEASTTPQVVEAKQIACEYAETHPMDGMKLEMAFVYAMLRENNLRNF